MSEEVGKGEGEAAEDQGEGVCLGSDRGVCEGEGEAAEQGEEVRARMSVRNEEKDESFKNILGIKNII